MNRNHSNYTGRMHRTLTDAFGPYAHGSQLQPRQDPMPTADKIVVVGGLILMAVVAALVMMGVIK